MLMNVSPSVHPAFECFTMNFTLFSREGEAISKRRLDMVGKYALKSFFLEHVLCSTYCFAFQLGVFCVRDANTQPTDGEKHNDMDLATIYSNVSVRTLSSRGIIRL